MIITLQIVVILACLLLGTHYGGIGLGLISGIGLVILVFVFGLTPGEPPVSVMLTILAVIGCASVLQSAGGLDAMMQFAEEILRKQPKRITTLVPLTTWTLTVLCGTGHVVYRMFPIIDDIAIKGHIRPEHPMAASWIASQMGITGLRGHGLPWSHPGRPRRSRPCLLHPADPDDLRPRVPVRRPGRAL